VTHASEWLKPVARDEPAALARPLDEWLEYLRGLGIEAIGHGAVVLRRREGRARRGPRLRTALDKHTAELVPLLDGTRPLRDVLPQDERFQSAALPAVRRLLELGFLVRSAA
jgi:hypothetical protein